MSEIIIFIKRNVLDWQSIKKSIHLKYLIQETTHNFFLYIQFVFEFYAR